MMEDIDVANRVDWVDLYKELADKICPPYNDNRTKLVALLFNIAFQLCSK